MKKLMTILVFAGVLSVPSAVFAEANWYGSLRVGLESSNSELAIRDGGSRWGIMGSVDAGEGLTGVYRYETSVDADTATQETDGRLSFVGLSGGFGTVTLGQVWSASYNSVGAITDNSYHYGDSQTTYRHGDAISYAFSNDLMAVQLDAIYAKHPRDSQMNDLNKTEFGLSVNVGDIGRVAVAHTKQNFALTRVGANEDGGADSDSNDTGWKITTNSIAGEVSVSGLRVYLGSQKQEREFVVATGGAASGADAEQKTTFFGFGGSLGDTGISYIFQWRDRKNDRKPWSMGLGKSLGGDASINFEHSNVDVETATRMDATRLTLQINF